MYSSLFFFYLFTKCIFNVTDSADDSPKSILKFSQITTPKFESSDLEGLKVLKSVLKKESQVSQTCESSESFPRSIMKNDHLKSKEDQKGASKGRKDLETEENFSKQSSSEESSETESGEKKGRNTVPFTRSRIKIKQSGFTKNLDFVDAPNGVETVAESALSSKNTKQQSVSEGRKNVAK